MDDVVALVRASWLKAPRRPGQAPGTLSQRRAAPSERLRLRQEQAAPVLVILKADLITLRKRLHADTLGPARRISPPRPS